MKKKSTFLNLAVATVLIAVVLAGCFTIYTVVQPAAAVTGEQINITLTASSNQTDANAKFGILGFLIPNDFTVDEVTYTGDFSGSFSFLHPDSTDSYPSNVDLGQAWIDSMETLHPSGSEMQWVVFESNESQVAAVDTNHFEFAIKMTVGSTIGNFDLGYLLTESSSDFTDAGMWDVNLGNTITIGIVPVELTSFAASVVSDGIELNWSTATETNNSGFAIERSNDNSSFEKIAFVDGRGNSTSNVNYNYVDNSAVGSKLYYRLKQVDFDGSSEYSKVVEINNELPNKFDLSQNYPNPFNPSTTIQFSIATEAKVSLSIYNMLGEEVTTLVNNNYSAGTHNVVFNAANLTSGTYLYSINAVDNLGNSFSSTKKMILMK